MRAANTKPAAACHRTPSAARREAWTTRTGRVPDVVATVHAAVSRELAMRGTACTDGATPRVVLAVSGGRDSMVMLDAAAAVAHGWIAAVATFDHGTGARAEDAARLVAERSEALGLPVVIGRASGVAAREADWRAVRWRFLDEVAADVGAEVATAHTQDDQLETVLLRVLRGSGARGLAGLAAASPVRRPLLELTGEVIGAYARTRALCWIEDPSNRSRRHLRNRVRLDLIPRLDAAHPSWRSALLEAGASAAALRRDLDRFLEREVRPVCREGTLQVARPDLAPYDGEQLRLLWPPLAAQLGVTLDRRGTERVAEFTIMGRPGTRIPLSGGYEMVRHRDLLILRRRTDEILGGVALADGAVWGRWRFRRVRDAASGLDGADRWTAALPAGKRWRVRGWQPGDRMVPAGAAGPRRVRGVLRDAGIDAAARRGWPVVVAGGVIEWVPGVRRGSAATARSGRPVVVYRCDAIDP